MSNSNQNNRGVSPWDTASEIGAEDDFVVSQKLSDRPETVNSQERRLHLQAFDYWRVLNGDREFPLFTDLTPDGLQPFKSNCLLIEFSNSGHMVRYCGGDLLPLFGVPLPPGTLLETASEAAFTQALADRFQSFSERSKAAEFEFVDGAMQCRGIFLPFGVAGEHATFTMIVVNFRHQASHQPAPEDEPPTHLAALAERCADVGQAVVHPDSGSRESLYGALAEAMRFHETASLDKLQYEQFLASVGLRQQSRAPYTPALKLAFGKDYDKTRLTEYASALSFAARSGIDSSGLIEFLHSVPGGIKGCVQQLRALKKGKAGSGPFMSAEVVLEHLRLRPAISLTELKQDAEFSLVLVRKTAAGTNEILAPVKTPSHHLEKLARQLLEEDQEP